MDSLGSAYDWFNAVLGVTVGFISGVLWYRTKIVSRIRAQHFAQENHVIRGLEVCAFGDGDTQVFLNCSVPTDLIDPPRSEEELLLALDRQVRVAKAATEPERRIILATCIFGAYRRARGL